MKRAFILTSKNGYSTIEVSEEIWEAFKKFYDTQLPDIKPRKKYWNKTFILLIILITIFSLFFYRFQVGKEQIRSNCDKIAWKYSQPGNHHWGESNSQAYNWKYSQCLHSKGF